jgi:hypothetical protein
MRPRPETRRERKEAKEAGRRRNVDRIRARVRALIEEWRGKLL